MEKIVVVGGSVAGGFTAYHLAKNYDVEIIEEHNHFKKTCSGILTDPINDLIKIKNTLVENKIKNFRIYSPDNNFLELKFKKPDIVFNREKLNEYLVDLAVNKGATLKQSTKFIRTEKNKVIINHNNKEASIKTEYLIGADGSQSQVAKSSQIFKDRKFFIGAKAIIKMNHPNIIDVYPHYGCFSWVVPRNEDEVEIGTMSHYNDAQAFMRFLKKFSEFDIISKEASIIPIYDPNIKTYTKFNGINTYLVGDSATMAKATTGGSIMQSLTAAKILADSIINDKDYEKNWKKIIGKKLYLHLKLRESLDKFKEKDWNELVEKLQDKKIKEILETNSRDNPDFIFDIFVAKPSLLKFSKILLRR
jgi:flavin-dependent dehydrogenase